MMKNIGETEPRFGKYKNKGVTWNQVWDNDADYCVYLATQHDFAQKNYSLVCFFGRKMKEAGLSLEALLGKKAAESSDVNAQLQPPQQSQHSYNPFMPKFN